MMNKNKITVLYIVLGSILLSSCLKVNPKDAFYADNFYKTTADYRSAYIGVYATLLSDGLYGRNLWSNFDWGNDEINQNRVLIANKMFNYNYDATEADLNDTWTQLYNGIGRANSFLANLQNLSDSLSYYAAEVRFLRGYFYFLLAQHWGNVPLRDKPFSSLGETTDINFQPVDSVYLFAINDMETAYPQLQTITKTGAGRVSKTTCAGILARANLYAASYCYDADKPAQYKQVKGKNFEAQLKNTSAQYFYKQVKRWADTVMIVNSDYYNATGIKGIGYDTIFMRQAQDQYYTKESMWEVEFLGNRAGAFSDYYTAGRVGVYNGIAATSAGFGFVSPYLARSYDTAKDARYKRNVPYISYTLANGAITTTTTISKTNNTCTFGKWRRTDEKILPLNTNYTPTNFPLLRYSDVVLMAAEATNELMLLYGEATPSNALDIITQLQAIKERAKTTNVVGTLGTFALRDSIRVERLRELAGEGVRKQDLVRWGTYLSQINITLQLYNSFMSGAIYSIPVLENIVNGGIKFIIQPIPQGELNLNKASTAVQHPLWQ